MSFTDRLSFARLCGVLVLLFVVRWWIEPSDSAAPVGLRTRQPWDDSGSSIDLVRSPSPQNGPVPPAYLRTILERGSGAGEVERSPTEESRNDGSLALLRGGVFVANHATIRSIAASIEISSAEEEELARRLDEHSLGALLADDRGGEELVVREILGPERAAVYRRVLHERTLRRIDEKLDRSARELIKAGGMREDQFATVREGYAAADDAEVRYWTHLAADPGTSAMMLLRPLFGSFSIDEEILRLRSEAFRVVTGEMLTPSQLARFDEFERADRAP